MFVITFDYDQNHTLFLHNNSKQIKETFVRVNNH